MSSSPILSIINDFLVLVSVEGSEADGPRLIDICNDNDIGEVCLFLSNDETCSFFAEDWDVDSEVTFEAGLYTLGVGNTGVPTFDIGFFVVVIISVEFSYSC